MRAAIRQIYMLELFGVWSGLLDQLFFLALFFVAAVHKAKEAKSAQLLPLDLHRNRLQRSVLQGPTGSAFVHRSVP
jgi:hypothetical protein